MGRLSLPFVKRPWLAWVVLLKLGQDRLESCDNIRGLAEEHRVGCLALLINRLLFDHPRAEPSSLLFTCSYSLRFLTSRVSNYNLSNLISDKRGGSRQI